MAQSIVGFLRVNLGLDSAQFAAGLVKAQSGLAKFSTFAKVGLAAAAASAAAGIGAMAVSVRNTVDAADDMSKAAAKIGIPIEELSRLKYAADLSGLSFEGMQTAVGRLSQNMADAAAGIGEGAAALGNLGISATDADGSLRPVTEIMAEIAERFSDMPDGAGKTAAAMDLMGRSGRDMIPLLNGGRGALEKLTAEADRFSQVFSAEMGAQAEEFNDNLSRLSGIWGNLAADLAQQLLPHLASFSEWLVANEPNIRRVTTAAVDLVAGIGSAIGAFLAAAEQVGTAVSGMIATVGAAAQSVADFAISVDQSLRDLSDQIVAIFAALPAQMVEIGGQIIDGLWQGISKKFWDVEAKLSNLSDRIADTVKAKLGIQSPSKVFAAIGRNLMAGLGQGISDGFGDAEGPMGTALDNIGSQISGFFQAVLFDGRSFRDDLAELLSGIGGRLLDQGINALFGALIPGFAGGTNFAPGGLAMVGERGPELVNLPRGSRVTPNHRLPDRMGGAVDVRIGVDESGNLRPFVERTAGMISAQALGAYDKGLPGRIAGIGRDPRVR